jgi:hypothetical protein
MPRADWTRWRGIPVTTPARALLDLAVALRLDEAFAWSVHEAEIQTRVTTRSLEDVIERHPKNGGCARLAAEIADGPKPARSRLEIRVLRLLRRHDFPPFDTNVHPPGLPAWVEVDVLFAERRVVIEADGGQFHDTAFRRKRDARKQALLEAAGYRVIRLRWEDVAPELEAQTVARLQHAVA